MKLLFYQILFCIVSLWTTPFTILANNPETQDDSFISLETEKISLSFAASGKFHMEKMRINNKDLLPDNETDTHPWEITYIGPNGENPLLKPLNGYYEGGKIIENTPGQKTLVFSWKMILVSDADTRVRMYVTIREDTNLVEWNLEADVPEGWIVSELEFPRITLNRTPKDKAIISSGWGAQYPLSSSSTLTSRYPSGTGTMQMVMMHDDTNCFYYATEDFNASDKRFKINGGNDNATFATQTITSEAWSPEKGGVFRLPWPTLMGYTDNGWAYAVKNWYKPFTYQTVWGDKSLSERNIPQWLYQADVWLRPMNVEKETMEAVRKAIPYYGKGVGLHWYYWHQHPFDTKYPEYFPTKEGFIDMVKETEKLGGHITPYINGRLWDPDTESYKSLDGKKASVRKPDGKLYTEVYSSKVINTVTCPASTIWQNVQKELIRKLQDEVGVSGIYIDQIAAAPAEPCWAEGHNHPKGGGEFWHKAYRELYQDIRKNILKKDRILTSEENAECYIDLFDMLLIVNSPLRYSTIVPLFPLVYSDRAITSAFAYTPYDLTTGSFRYLNMMSLLWGAQLGWVEPILLMKEESKQEAAFLKEMMEFRRNYHSYFYGGEFMSEIIPEGDNPVRAFQGYGSTHAVRGALWKDKDGKNEILFLVNIDNENHEITLPWNKKIVIQGKSCMAFNTP